MSDVAYIKNSFLYRGYIIDTFNTLEKRIEFIISDHFIGSLDHSFISIILDRLNFEAKRSTIKAIFEKLEEETGVFKNEANKNPHKKVLEETRLLSLERNYFAHHILGFPSDDSDAVIGLAENRDKLTTRFYSKEDISKIADRIVKVSEELESRYMRYQESFLP